MRPPGGRASANAVLRASVSTAAHDAAHFPTQEQSLSRASAVLSNRVLNIVRGDDHLGAFSCGDVLVCTKNQGNTDEDEIERFMPGINGDVGIVNNPSSGITVTEAHEIVATGKDMRHAHATTVHKS